jgi:hypothetical protein
LAEVQPKLNLNEFYFLGLAHKEFIVDVLSLGQPKKVSTNRFACDGKGADSPFFLSAAKADVKII